MPRPPFIHYPGALYHITARGNNKQDIFHNEKDFSRYLSNIKLFKKEVPFYLYAFALMPNHIHLLIEVIDSPISKIMQKLQTAYTMFVNKKYQRVGHVFQGRYFHLLVDKESHLLELMRYIHLNPVRAGLVDNPQNYAWSSHNSYLKLDSKAENFIDKEKVLPYFSSDPKKAIKNYEEFVLAGLETRWEDISMEIKRDNLLGSDKFVQRVDRGIIKKRNNI
ncbi:MAG: transposase [Patescibacteria group bacterium]